MITIVGTNIAFYKAGLFATYELPLLRLERCPFCREGIIRAWFSLPEGVRKISPLPYEGLPLREEYKSAFQIVLVPGYEGLVRRCRLYWQDSNQAICKRLYTCTSPSRSVNLRELLSEVSYCYPLGDAREEITRLLGRLSDDQWDYLAHAVLPQYLNTPFAWGGIRAPVEELSGESSATLVLKKAEGPETDWREWRDSVSPEAVGFIRELVTAALQPGRGERYAQIRPWQKNLMGRG